MNALLLIGIIFALSGFRPKTDLPNGEKPQITQGYYDPKESLGGRGITFYGKRLMGTPSSLGNYMDWVRNKPLDQLETIKGEYFVLDKKTGKYNNQGEAKSEKIVFLSQGRSGGFLTVQKFNPMNYTTENIG